MIRGKQLCELADRECDAQPAAIALVAPIPVILDVVYPCAFPRETTRGGEKEKKKKGKLVLKGVNHAASAAARPFCLFIANTIYYTMRDGWKRDVTIIVAMAWEDICMANCFSESPILFTHLAGPHSHLDLPT
jgi:hypothetical protein